MSDVNNPPSPVATRMPVKRSDIAGLTQAEAVSRLNRNGRNVLPEAPVPGWFATFVAQFKSPFIYILLVAALASAGLQQYANAVFIGAVLLLNATIGGVQEYGAQRAAQALKQMVRGTCRVLRDQRVFAIDIEEVVCGDVVELASGDKVPADLKLEWAQGLTVDESQLTGESLPIAKLASATGADSRDAQLFAGSPVTHGRALGRVVATGSNTALGRIATGVGGERVADPPLMIRIRQFTYQVALAILAAIVVLVVILQWRGGYDTSAIAMMVIGLAVSTIPEGLPAALTVALAIGMRRMAGLNVIIRKLVAVEALGSCTLICSDKTGTLTVNELTIRKAVLPDGTHATVSSADIHGGSFETPAGDALIQLIKAGVYANESHLDYDGGNWEATGDAVDVAFLVLAKKAGLSITALHEQAERVALTPYESERAYSASAHAYGGQTTLYVKGSPERVLPMCNRLAGDQVLSSEMDTAIRKHASTLAAQGYRVIALASGPPVAESESPVQLEYLGLVGMHDPIRPEATQAIQRCRAGGVEVAMVTGDHPVTARAIAMELGLVGADAQIVTGDDIHALDNCTSENGPSARARLDELVLPARVFARIEPWQKQQIVECFMRAGHFVAVTGDGVNDAPAMQQAHAGVAMGKRGTDVAKESADLIITDDNFASIVSGIEQGRVVYNNIRKVVALLIATGFSALVLFLLCAITGLPMPLTALQLLWLNLIANGVQDVALAFEPAEGSELDRPPRAPDERIFDRRVLEHVLVVGSIMGLLAFSVFAWLLDNGTTVEAARNLVLMQMVLFGNIHALSSRSETRSLFTQPLLGNVFLIIAVPAAQLLHITASYVPAVQATMEVQPVSLLQWLVLLGVACVLLGTEETHKAWLRYRHS